MPIKISNEEILKTIVKNHGKCDMFFCEGNYKSKWQGYLNVQECPLYSHCHLTSMGYNNTVKVLEGAKNELESIKKLKFLEKL